MNVKTYVYTNSTLSSEARNLATRIEYLDSKITIDQLKTLKNHNRIDELGFNGYIEINPFLQIILYREPQKKFKNAWFKNRKTII